MATRANTHVSHREVVQDRRFAESYGFRFSTWSGFLPMSLLRKLADRVAGTLYLGMAPVRSRPLRKDIPIEDCIEFINSCSLSRSTSTAKHSP
ncbi:josephin-like protein [Pyrus ussuriensis x Pyrus communis]|uniref:Josephin-like protein n=1 Tax=Pyrus ussuriensis x Pyrus communis TaxID=2448454 RepID=A0A5N5FZP9_9ROSA|nr:josephin-like protein [Pyrus ussuriensis x Pyrus communis]